MCFVFGSRSDLGSGTYPTVLSHCYVRYRQLLFPALRLCLAVLTSLGIENMSASNQVLKFILGHSDVFSAILREPHTKLNLVALQELSLTTSVLSRAAMDGKIIFAFEFFFFINLYCSPFIKVTRYDRIAGYKTISR